MAASMCQQTERLRRRGSKVPLAVGVACALALCQGTLSFAAPRQTKAAEMQRRDLLAGLGVSSALQAAPAFALDTYKDKEKGYSLSYPTGLQKSDSKVFDYFLRDLIEPLEYVAVKVVETNRKSLDEIGDAMEVGKRFLKDLAPEKAPQEVISAVSKKDYMGRRKDIIEFAYQWKFDEAMAQKIGRKKFQLHGKAIVEVVKRQQYVCIIASEEDRWKFRGDDYDVALSTFQVDA
mmetsp:Transcript_13865/g.24421  ORF Transcript_13865/g.24421 Transcript_13865/m.24421 type:complete len:234 (+) Transcript_13865:67-768(+)|eukprot:CAMPEP_0197650768 /NCGR_PEP_ID=MMETSP1338-20131121/31145_1 /TAXON_ID=43686 ORGANISM="Pelagodinium beii, Strain RCC1491" /NCGR_SAMPLE_ID=MMETSP1338 /ASSEMBLY_ACC=CAM_ASM_000754 /LENGTH=233 /DNA_ID=CAMNT_0043225243 /DNA_START=67 /DNA_END=768 /DNA_ORIENTATION=-